MVLQKRLDYGFNGYQVPPIPRGSRSARGRRSSFRKKVEDSMQMCAFELLATVAGELLQEKESSSDSSNTSAVRSQRSIVQDTVKQEQQDEEEKVVKVEPNEQGRRVDETSSLVSELGLHGHNHQGYISKGSPLARNVGLSSDIDNADLSEKDGSANKASNENEVGKFLKVESDSPCYGESCEVKVVDRIGRQIEARSDKIANNLINGRTLRDSCSSDDPMELDNNKPPALVTSDSSIEVPKCKDSHISRGCFPGYRDNKKVVSRDDDENSSACTQPSTRNMKAFRPSPRFGDRRIRKLLASKYWKVAPKLKDGERSRTDMKLIFHNRRNSYTRQRSQRNSPFKRRKLFGRGSVLTSEGGISNEGISKSPEKAVGSETAGAASRASSSVSGQRSSFQSRDSHVKLSIKSFRVPELFIEIPETATVGSLKRSVMEAVTAILGGGLRVGVVLKGNKVRDDNKTLVQTGISNNEKLDNLGFTLEPNPAHAPPPPMHPEDPSYPVSSDTPQPLTRYPTTPALDSGMSDATLYPAMTNLGSFIESDHDSVPSPTETSADNITQDSRALVPISAMSVDPLSAVPLHRKPRRSELVQRRIRRPFSVSEVEALVHAVEKLGTGRWRDVKLRAFDNAKHRTYVDLKDKWKTLVHTARISPQQRRGEPVPQELLDRVLSAHAYWTQQQAKQQVKQQNETCLLL